MAAPNMEIFNQYFAKADLDRDGRISGAEAVSFFQGSNLPKQVLAQIWMHADQNRTGFLGRPEFYNALKLVTVAQSGRELTPDIVKAALVGPASAKIPAPKIDSVSVPATQSTSSITPRPPSSTHMSSTSHMGPPPRMGSTSQMMSMPQRGPVPQTATTPQMGVTSQMSSTSQNFGFRGPQVLSNMGNQSTSSSFNNNFMTPPQSTTPTSPLTPMRSISQNQSFPNINTPNLSSDWNVRSSGASIPGVAPKPQTSNLGPASSKASFLSGNNFPLNSIFGDVSSANQAKPGALTSAISSTSMTNASSASSVSSGVGNSVKSDQPDSFQNILALAPGGAQIAQSHLRMKQNQVDATRSTPSSSNASSESIYSSTSPSQPQWPKITQTDIRKYIKVFVEVDKDRDGKITGEQARNLFLSWKLPREVLKQVWDLSDQDSDSMLTLREFCIALYLMERYKEGRPLPSELPNSLRFDETLLQATGQPSTAYAAPSWQMKPGLPQPEFAGQRPGLPTSGPRPHSHHNNVVGSMHDGSYQPTQNMSRVPVNDRNMHNQQSKDEQGTQAGADEVKAQEVEKIMDSREKVEYYRTKMQELVLYKSRCDNRLNEISERASADKHEVETLAKKYEERYKQVAEIASKLTVEEATFRHVQERKVELHNALLKMEQGGSVDGLLQVRADRIQSDLDELAKALSQRSKHYGIDLKTTASVELPFGWQPGIQEGAIDWDEEWDKFEDEGFTIGKEPSDKVDVVATPSKDSPKLWGDELFAEDNSSVESPSHIHGNAGEHIYDNESADARSENESHGTPKRTTFDSPSRDIHSSFHDNISPRAKDNFSDHDGAESTVYGDKFGEESWGANFDTNDDVDSVWGFNAKDAGNNSFFGSDDFGLNPIKMDSPNSISEFGKDKRTSLFADSNPNSPLFNSSSPQSFNDGFDNHTFDASSRFDSFSMHDTGLFSKRPETLSRFDSIQSNSGYNHNQGFSFDDGDPFGSTGPFKSTGDNHSPTKGSDS